MISFHSVECYCLWHLSQYSDSLEAGLYAVCLLAEARYLLSFQTPDQPLAHLACCSVDAVDPSPALKQLMHEANHLSVFCAEVTDGRSCNCACGKCLHAVHRDSFTFYCCFVGMTAIFIKPFALYDRQLKLLCSLY
jgi:hypothetical protein